MARRAPKPDAATDAEPAAKPPRKRKAKPAAPVPSLAERTEAFRAMLRKSVEGQEGRLADWVRRMADEGRLWEVPGCPVGRPAGEVPSG